MKVSAPLKVGILTILSTLILIFGIMWLKGRSISIGEKIAIRFKDVDGMRPGSAVQMMGLRIGQVDEIIPVINGEDSYVLVKFVINEPNVTIPPASKISIQQSGIIGEKFLEIMPPFPKIALLRADKAFNGALKPKDPVELLIDGKYKEIGYVKETEFVQVGAKKAYKIKYIVNLPGVEIPISSREEITKKSLRITPPRDIVVKLPKYDCKYTVVEPLRLKEFLDVQLEAALALKDTNDKINELFTDQFMDDVKLTFENARDLSEKAAYVMDQVAVIVESSKGDIKELIVSSTKLSKNMTELSDNLNKIVGDKQFKKDILATTSSIRSVSDEFSTLLKNSKLQDSLQNINSSTRDMAEITQYVNNLTKDEDFNNKINDTVENMNTLMVKLTKVSDSLNDLTVEEKESIKKIIDNSNQASEDIKKFSGKLNKRFLLLRLLL